MNWPKWDSELFLQWNALGDPTYDALWLAISGTWIWLPWYAFLIYLLYRFLDRQAFVWALFFVLLNVVLTDKASVWLFKETFQRLRPCHEEELLAQMRLVKAGCGGLYGFVSSHAANVFGLASLLIGLIGRGRWWLTVLLLLWAGTVAFSRVYLGVHYPFDIFGGALLGIACGSLMLHFYKSALKRG